MSAALRSSHGLVMTGALTLARKQTNVNLVYRSRNTFELAFRSEGSDASMIVLPDAGYIRANEAFWMAHGAGGRGRPRVGGGSELMRGSVVQSWPQAAVAVSA